MTETNSIPQSVGINVIVLGSQSCGPCKQLKSVIDAANLEVECYYMDISKCSAWATRHQVRTLPTTLLRNGVDVVDVIMGNSPIVMDRIVAFVRDSNNC
jgi:thioredoxin-like negative regulator of GroEL